MVKIVPVCHCNYPVLYLQNHEGIAADLGYNGVHPNFKKPFRNPIRGIHGRTGLVPSGISLKRTISQPISMSQYPPKVPALMDMDIDMDGKRFTYFNKILLMWLVFQCFLNNSFFQMDSVLFKNLCSFVELLTMIR